MNFERLIAQCNLEFKGRLHFLRKIHALRHRGRSEGVKATDLELAIIGLSTPSMIEFC